MNLRAGGIKAMCLATSACFVVALSHLAFSAPVVELDGGGEAMQARIGSSFEDMAAGTLTAENTLDETPVAEPQTDATPTTPTKALAARPAPIPARTVQAVPTPTAVAPAAIPAVTPSTQLAALPRTRTVEPIRPKATSAVPATTAESLTATEPESAAPAQAMRPRPRDPAKAAKVAAAQPKPPNPKPRAKAGNARRNNTQGAETGTQTAKARTKGNTGKKARQSGTAAASNYPGQVMRRIARVPKPRVNNRGTAVIAFAVSSSGRLASASVARSSGSARLDKAALRVVRQASPFPKPPRGAQRRFSIRIKGR